MKAGAYPDEVYSFVCLRREVTQPVRLFSCKSSFDMLIAVQSECFAWHGTAVRVFA